MSWLRAVFPMILEIAQQKVRDYLRMAVNPKLFRASPGVSERLLGGVAHAGILLHHVADEIFGCG